MSSEETPGTQQPEQQYSELFPPAPRLGRFSIYRLLESIDEDSHIVWQWISAILCIAIYSYRLPCFVAAILASTLTRRVILLVDKMVTFLISDLSAHDQTIARFKFFSR